MVVIRSKDRRSDVRTCLEAPYRARIDDGTRIVPFDCTILDISADGARLAMAHARSLPANVTLLLSCDGKSTRRSCCVTWRADEEIRVEFLDETVRMLVD